MSVYHPDKWALVKIYPTPDEVFFKVLGSWYGGYLGSDSWRLNSGIVSAEEDGNYWIFHGESGSEYRCHKESYGMHMVSYSDISSFENKSEGRLEVLHDMPDIEKMTWS